MRDRFRNDPAARELLADLETGRIGDADFEPRFAGVLGVEQPDGLIDAAVRAACGPTRRCSTRVRAARRAGIRTGLISNSWGEARYDRARFDELFDGW